MSKTDNPMPTWLEDAWLSRYVDRQLTDPEIEWFEAYAMDKPELLARIEDDLELRDGLAVAAAEGALAAAPLKLEAVRPRQETGAARGGSGGVWMARAASLAVAAGLGWISASLLPFEEERQGTVSIVADPMRVVFDTLRGASQAPLVFNAGSQSELILVEVGLPPDASDVQLLRGAQQPLPLALSAEGFVSFLLPRSAAGTSGMEIRYTTAGAQQRRPLNLPDPKGEESP